MRANYHAQIAGLGMNRFTIGVLAGVICAPSLAPAQCTGYNYYTGQPQIAVEIPGPSPFWAHVSHDPLTGAPMIIYGPIYFQLSRTMQRFVSFHECCHHQMQTSNEIATNCCALRQMNPSQSQLNEIAFTHISVGSLPPQYGGSGVNFWELTLQQCRN